ncbi:MAG TPA: hypothetical protein VF472_13345 [Burkholderiaceae bacterium]
MVFPLCWVEKSSEKTPAVLLTAAGGDAGADAGDESRKLGTDSGCRIAQSKHQRNRHDGDDQGVFDNLGSFILMQESSKFVSHAIHGSPFKI